MLIFPKKNLGYPGQTPQGERGPLNPTSPQADTEQQALPGSSGGRSSRMYGVPLTATGYRGAAMMPPPQSLGNGPGLRDRTEAVRGAVQSANKAKERMTLKANLMKISHDIKMRLINNLR